jgi:hypothetical protein
MIRAIFSLFFISAIGLPAAFGTGHTPCVHLNHFSGNACTFNNGPFIDLSKADVDGPHVFYRGKQTVVKYVVKKDTSAIVTTTKYNKKEEIRLTCRVSETGDTFSFPLKKNLSIERDYYRLPEKMLVVSDIEGNFTAFKMMLMSARVIDAQFKWTFGKGHLVLLGDFMDRGLSVTECLWLAYKLEDEAEEAGGKVHFILGNHEILNLEGNAQYVRKKYLENASVIGEPFARWFDNNSELGRWMRTKNAIEKIGDFAFCHGGISPELIGTGLTFGDINRISRQYLGVPYLEINNPEATAVFDVKTGVFWYRNLAKGIATNEIARQALNFTGSKRLVLGHTLQNDITAYYNGQVICIDLYHEENLRNGFVKSLWIEDGACYGLDSKGEKSSVFAVVMQRE